jgi:hypothetical protein
LRTSFALLDSQARGFFFFFHQLESRSVPVLLLLKTESFFGFHVGSVRGAEESEHPSMFTEPI